MDLQKPFSFKPPQGAWHPLPESLHCNNERWPGSGSRARRKDYRQAAWDRAERPRLMLSVVGGWGGEPLVVLQPRNCKLQPGPAGEACAGSAVWFVLTPNLAMLKLTTNFQSTVLHTCNPRHTGSKAHRLRAEGRAGLHSKTLSQQHPCSNRQIENQKL